MGGENEVVLCYKKKIFKKKLHLPENKFLLANRYSSFWSDDIAVGNFPQKQFSSRSTNFKLTSDGMISKIFPSKRFVHTENFTRFVNFEISVGTVDVNLLKLTLKLSNAIKFDSETGRLPRSEFWDKSNITKEFRLLKILSDRLPFKL